MRKSLLYLLMLSLCAFLVGVAMAQDEQEEPMKEITLPDPPFIGDNGEGAPVPCNTVPGNLVANCGFETGSFAMWTQSGDLSFTDVIGGARFTGNFGGRFGPVDDLGFIAQQLTTVPGQSYTLTFPLRNNGGPNRFQVSWGGQVIYDSSVGDFQYHRPQSGFEGLVARGASTELKIGFFNLPDYIFIDDIVVVPSAP